jgi:hypothetical protein
MMFRTVSWNPAVEPTGIRDQLPPPHGDGRPYGNGLLAQQWLAFGRIFDRVRGKRAYAPGTIDAAN